MLVGGVGMSKKAIKIIIVLVITLLIPISNSLASTDIDTSGYKIYQSTLHEEFDGVGKVILGAVQGIGIGISVIVLAILGIKYMVGSVEEKADYKASMIPYLIGVFFLASATTIPNLIYQFMQTWNI